ncbi:hypothetical protein [Leisingera sp. ANG-S5]|uniref:hypothetical protein n=1 Tax=Leisingera sp. ANG-S5 TaxID=1577901 RepID=UPI00057CD6DD|nr:hypothetical protein [Leisingera sp. ANG-S5]KIC34275.1 hypothetical protein RA25_00210 [Leisingera sp. ANG-S5]
MKEKYVVSGENTVAAHVWAANAAWNLVKKVGEADQSDERGGLTYLCMSALVLTAFANEANLNVVGSHVFGGGWPDSAKATEKLELLKKHFSLNRKDFEDACSAAKGLIKMRNQMAHPKLQNPKPFRKEFDGRPSEKQLSELQRPPFLASFTVAEVNRQYAAMELIFKTLLGAADLDVNHYSPSGSLTISKLSEEDKTFS